LDIKIFYPGGHVDQTKRWANYAHPTCSQRGGGYDHNLWTPAKVFEKINYIHASPVR
jgi:hypothetical protein